MWHKMATALTSLAKLRLTECFSFSHKLRHRFRAGLHMQLLVNAPDIIPHRVDTYAELISDLFISKPFGQTVEYRTFPLGKIRRFIALRWRGFEGMNHLTRNRS